LYDANHRLTNDRFGPLTATFSYDATTGTLSGADLGDGRRAQGVRNLSLKEKVAGSGFGVDSRPFRQASRDSMLHGSCPQSCLVPFLAPASTLQLFACSQKSVHGANRRKSAQGEQLHHTTRMSSLLRLQCHRVEALASRLVFLRRARSHEQPRKRAGGEGRPEMCCWDRERVPGKCIIYCTKVYIKAVVKNSPRSLLACLALQPFKRPGRSLARQNHSPVWLDWGQVKVHPCAVGAEFARIRAESAPSFRTPGARSREGRGSVRQNTPDPVDPRPSSCWKRLGIVSLRCNIRGPSYD
jgi:hypothetical protein